MRPFKELEKVSRRRENILGPLFSGGLSPAGTFLGDDSGLERRMGGDSDLSMNGFSLGASVKNAVAKWAALISRSGGILCHFFVYPKET
jgi:hypothetical protein